MSKKIATIVVVTFLSLAIAPATLGQGRNRRNDCSRSTNTRSYNSYPDRGVAGQRYYAEPYYRGGAPTRYYGADTRYYGGRYYQDRNSTTDAVLTVAAPAAIGAGVGAILEGSKGAAVGALLGGGGGALFYLLKHNGRHR